MAYETPNDLASLGIVYYIPYTSTFKGVPYMVPLQGVNSLSLRVFSWHPFEGAGKP